MLLDKIINSIGHRLIPFLSKYNQYKKSKCFVASDLNEELSSKELIYTHEQICSELEYKDETWSGIKYLGDIMWNNAFRYLPVFKRKRIIDLEMQCTNTKVNFVEDEVVCKSANIINDWIFLKKEEGIEFPYILEFEAKIMQENSEFQFAFFYENIGNRYRFNLKKNRILAFEVVENGDFHNDIFKAALTLPIDEWVSFKITIKKDYFIYTVNNKDILCIKQVRDLKPLLNNTFALILWDSTLSNIDTRYRNLKIYKI